MKTTTKTTEKSSLAGIDCSSRSLAVCALRRGQEQNREFENTPGGHRQLISWLGKTNTRVCIEATGMYHLDCCVAMHQAGIAVMVLNPRASNAYQRSRMVRAKTDRIDAKGLLDYVLRQEFKPWTPPQLVHLQLRQITRRMTQLIEQITQERNRISSAKASRYTPAVVIRDMRQSVREHGARLKELQQQAIEVAQSDPWLMQSMQLLSSCKGIAERSALLLLGDLSVLPTDMTPRQWVAHAGLDPRPIESGKKTGAHAPPRRISRQGNPRIRAALYMPALVAIRWNQAVKAHYEHLLQNGKAKLCALIAIMRKLLHAIWAMLHYRTEFDINRFSQFYRNAKNDEMSA